MRTSTKRARAIIIIVGALLTVNGLLALLTMAKSAKSRKTSPIWNYFEVGEDTKFANCNICKEPVSRGGKTTKTFNTSNLVGHLKKHSEQYGEYEKAVAAGDTDKGKKKATPDS